MSTPRTPARPLSHLKRALRQCRSERQQRRAYATATEPINEAPKYPSLQPRYPPPSKGFRPGLAIQQNRPDSPTLKKIRVIPPPLAIKKTCPDPIGVITNNQISVLDPTGARTRLFSKANPERVQPGDTLLVRQRTGDPFAGVCLVVRQRNSPIDTSILLRNNLTRVGVEMWFKVYSPNVEGIEIVQRRVKRARRAKLYYMRQPRHDVGSVENVVRQYLRQRMGGGGAAAQKAGSGKKKGGKKR